MTPKPKPQGRPPKLDDRQKGEIIRRSVAGEKPASIIKAFRISRSTFYDTISGQVPVVQKVASDLAIAEANLARLPVAGQQAARTLADQMKSVQDSLGQAAANGARTHEILSGLAVKKAEGIKATSEADGEITEDLKTVAQLAMTGNEASKVATTLITAAKGKAEENGMLTLAELLGG